jgi:hypothetical protein
MGADDPLAPLLAEVALEERRALKWRLIGRTLLALAIAGMMVTWVSKHLIQLLL